MLGAALLIAAGCASTDRMAAVPETIQPTAQVPDFPDVRYFAPQHDELLERDALEAIRREQDYLHTSGHRGKLPLARFLAISGGGENGAFGAGLLTGWTARGDRPELKVVTGVGTGALTAPFAFLGPAWDAKLRAVYVDSSVADIVEPRGWLTALFGDALGDTAPLRRMVYRMMDDDMVRAIAAEHARGRLLLIGTTNLDARRGAIWNIGKIAASGHPRARALITEILVASAAIPGVFPPVMIDVEADGRRYQEMHVDGGATAQVFVYPPAFRLDREAREIGVVRQRAIFVIRNARLEPDWAQVDRRAMSIAGRSISSMIQTQGVGDLYRIYATSRRDGVAFNLALIPDSFRMKLPAPFDRDYMRTLYDTGYELGRNGGPWLHAPPGLGAAPGQ